jgi:tetratricopeptide (TPR) repeat protein
VSTQRRDAPHDTLEQIQSAGDRLAHWVASRPRLVLGIGGAVLLAAAATGGYLTWRESRGDAASSALGRVQREYVVAMGGQPGDMDAPEPANPETARTVRNDFVQRFLTVARDHGGTPTAALASLEASEIYHALGAPDQALETLHAAADAQPDDSPVRAVVLTRMAGLHEADGDFAEAARAHQAAAEIESYPLRYAALGDAARCWAEAGDAAAALAAFERLRAEAPETPLAPYVEARLSELRNEAKPAPATASPPP